MLYKIWNLLPLFIQRRIKKRILLQKNNSISLNNIKILDNFLLNDLLHGNISFGKNCFLGLKDNSFFGKIEIGDYTYIGFPNNGIYSCTDYNIKIGKFCSIARNLFIINYNGHSLSNFTTSNCLVESSDQDKLLGGDIIIGNDVWIGANVTILPGVSIGNGVVIGAGSVVTKDVDSYMIVAGNPAKVIKERFSLEKRKKLEESKWWDWPIEKIRKQYSLNTLNEI